MLDIVLKILSVIGIVLLVLLAVLVIALLLVLFFPITYKAFGKKNEKDIQAWVKANWLFGLLRVRFYYPKPGNITVKLLWFTLHDSSKCKQEVDHNQKKPENSEQAIQESAPKTSTDETTQETQTASDVLANVEGLSDSKSAISTEASENNVGEEDAAEGMPTAEDVQNQKKKTIQERILEKYEKIKYTIRKIYDKIKHILENLSFYKNLLQDEQTKGLLQHAFSRIGRILKSIRPRRLKGDILFGTGAPDTTGYLFGIYGMFIPLYGKYMNVTPDFTQAILEGELYAAGHITVFQLLRHGLMVLLDKRLRLLIHRIKTHTI